MTAPLPAGDPPRGSRPASGSDDPLRPVPLPASPARLRLTAALRHVVDATYTAEPDEAALAAAADAVEALAVELSGRHPSDGPPSGRRTRAVRDAADYVGRSPLVGEASPISPPFTWEGGPEGVRAWGVFRAAFEGPPGYAHGGWIALAFDEVFGITNAVAGRGAMTASLRVRYRHPTPLHEPVEIAARLARESGRRSVVTGELVVGGRVTAEAEGHFVTIDAERAERYFGTATGTGTGTGTDAGEVPGDRPSAPGEEGGSR